MQRARPTRAWLPATCASYQSSVACDEARFRLLETNCASGFEQPCARVDSQGASTHRSPHAWLPATHTPTDRAHGRERAHHGGEVRVPKFSFFCMYVHALTCRHPCQRGGARGSHARVDLGDLLTARMSGAGCAGRSVIQQPPLSRRPSPLPQLQPQPPRANLQTVPSGACVQHLLARIVGCSVAHQRARPPCARQHIAWSRRWGMRLGLWLWLGLRMRRRCGDGGGGAAVGCRRLPSATRPAAERPAERWTCP